LIITGSYETLTHRFYASLVIAFHEKHSYLVLVIRRVNNILAIDMAFTTSRQQGIDNSDIAIEVSPQALRPATI
jgi:hypothetical protein